MERRRKEDNEEGFLRESQSIRRRGRKGEGKRGKKKVIARKDKVRMIYWNIAGMKKKGKEFWEHIERFDVIGLCETWIEEKEWEKIRSKLPSKFIWKCQYAERDERKGRAKGGIVTGVRRGMEEIAFADNNVNGVQERRLIDGDRWGNLENIDSIQWRKYESSEKKFRENDRRGGRRKSLYRWRL